MDQLRGLTAVVTGGGSGIGRSLCVSCANEGMNVVVADVEVERAKDLASELSGQVGIGALGVGCDVSSASSVDALADAAFAEFGAVNLLCNNAGVGQTGRIVDSPLEDWDWVFSVNVFGVVNGVRAFVPRMRAQDGPGHVLNTASLSGLFALKGIGVYTASKYAVMAISETLRLELGRADIGVSVLCPGPTLSRIGETMRHVGLPADAPRPDMTAPPDDMAYLGLLDPDDVACAALDGIKANRLYIFSHAAGRIATEERFGQILDEFSSLDARETDK